MGRSRPCSQSTGDSLREQCSSVCRLGTRSSPTLRLPCRRGVGGRWQTSLTSWAWLPLRLYTHTHRQRSIHYDEGNRKGVRTRYAPPPLLPCALHSCPPARPDRHHPPVNTRLHAHTHARGLGAVWQRIPCFALRRWLPGAVCPLPLGGESNHPPPRLRSRTDHSFENPQKTDPRARTETQRRTCSAPKSEWAKRA